MVDSVYRKKSYEVAFKRILNRHKKHFKQRSNLAEILDNLRYVATRNKRQISQREMDGYKLSQAEWSIYVSNLPDESLSTKRSTQMCQ